MTIGDKILRAIASDYDNKPLKCGPVKPDNIASILEDVERRAGGQTLAVKSVLDCAYVQALDCFLTLAEIREYESMDLFHLPEALEWTRKK